MYREKVPFHIFHATIHYTFSMFGAVSDRCMDQQMVTKLLCTHRSTRLPTGILGSYYKIEHVEQVYNKWQQSPL